MRTSKLPLLTTPMFRLSLLSLLASASAQCLVVHDYSHAAQSLKIEAYGANAVRVRAVPSGGT